MNTNCEHFFAEKDVSKSIKSLRNPKNPLPKMRQLMRLSCGDYRSKMVQDDKNFALSNI